MGKGLVRDTEHSQSEALHSNKKKQANKSKTVNFDINSTSHIGDNLARVNEDVRSNISSEKNQFSKTSQANISAKERAEASKKLDIGVWINLHL
jgi:hypothetical protein